MTSALSLDAENVRFGFDAEHLILKNWSASFHAGEVVAITGPSGRGKSTLLYILGLMLLPDSGQISLGGELLTGMTDADRAHARADRFGFVFQDSALDGSRSVLDNIIETALYRGAPRADARAQAFRLMERFGVELRSGAKPGQVSGGQAQRVALCRALLSAPQVILADEPTGNLDSESASVVLDALHEQAHQGSIVVIVTHDREVVTRCDRVVTL